MHFFRQFLFPFLIPMSWLYGFTILLRNQLYNLGWIKITSFDKPIISVGNITLGGSGKTPLVIYIAQLILKNGKNPGIISRGYGRKSNGIQIVHDGKELLIDVDVAGDEPYLMAQVLEKVPVVVCENRSRGIRQLLDYYSVNVVIMDDAFQHRKVNRDLNIVTISANEKHGNYWLIPKGNLREPLKNMKRANLVIYTKTENYNTPDIHTKIQQNYKGTIINSSLEVVLMQYNTSGYHKTPAPNKPLFAFCGIAEPDSFINYALKLGLKIEGRKWFRDHQDYNKTVIKQLSEQIRKSSSKYVVTTEKDLIKLPDSFLAEFEVYVIKINVVFENESIIKNIIQLLLN